MDDHFQDELFSSKTRAHALQEYLRQFLFVFYSFIKRLLVGWLVGWVLWHINLCRLFNAKSIFMKIVHFQTIQFRISMQSKRKYSLIVKNMSISSDSV